MLGAGHHAGMFLNLLDLKEFVDIVIDDDANRQGLYMPGTRLPIRVSSVLLEGRIGLCLLSPNPLNEEKVLAKLGEFLARGGVVSSIFPASSHALRI
jgi:hypothetical protein